ncbi:MAG TPA: hypothetical protein VHD38_01360 [Candidatus Paceibacterota bacterium]|nr:hypothetical protein [Candidatus Paceibacterota bacterium]
MRVVLAALVALFVATPAFAQFTIPGADTALSFSLSPRYPLPNQSVQISLQSFLYDLDASSIIWSEDGKIIAQGDGVKSVTIQAGALGSAHVIEADVNGASGQASAQITIAPASVDLLWEADSYVPPFYKGRALPSAGGTVRIAAIPHLIRSNGTAISPADIVFTWKKDGQLLEDISGRGKASAVVDGPTLFGSEAITVDAVSADGSLQAESILRLSDTKPRINLYENHPLFGILFGQALGSSTFIPDNEMTFAAVPYFAPVTSTSDRNLEYAWTVNGQPVATDSDHAEELTVNAASSTGVALLSLSLTHASNFFFGVDGSWQVTLNSRTSTPFNPFQ